jgi:hypothetical protein
MMGWLSECEFGWLVGWLGTVYSPFYILSENADSDAHVGL